MSDSRGFNPIEVDCGKGMESNDLPATHVFHKHAEDALARVLQVRIDDAGVDAVC